MGNNSAKKLLLVSLLGVLALWILHTLVAPTLGGFRAGYSGNFMGHRFGGGVYVGNGLIFGGTVAYILIVLIKIFTILLVLGLVAGVVIWIKNNIFTVEERDEIKGVFTCKNSTVKEKCIICEKELNSEWKVCPYCGKEKQ